MTTMPTTTTFDKHVTFVLSICNNTEHHRWLLWNRYCL